MAEDDAEPVVDPQEEDDQIDLDDLSGQSYGGEGGAPRVGEEERDDATVERRYRPDR